MENSILTDLHKNNLNLSLEVGSYEALWDQGDFIGYAKLAKTIGVIV